MKQILSTFFVLLLAVAISSGVVTTLNAQQKPNQIPKRNDFGCDRVFAYRSDVQPTLRLYLFEQDADSESKQPAVIFFFGGGWVGGTPAQFRPHAEYFKSRGMKAFLADYRTRKSHKTSPKECVADAQRAIRYLRQNADQLGIDPDRIVAAGGSAGGHLAAATATLKSFPGSALKQDANDDPVSCLPNALILFNPVFNNGPQQWGHGKVKEYWQAISPAHNIRKGIPPAIVFLGDNDKLISVETAKSFESKMKSVGSQSDLHIYKNQGHGFFNFGRGKNKAFIDTVKKADQFLIDLKMLTGNPTIDEFVKSYRTKK